MSSCHEETLKCPKCGTEFSFTVWDSVNADLNPELKKQIKSLELFQIKCPHCGQMFNCPYTILYNDMTRNQMVYYFPEGVSDKQAREEIQSPLLKKINGFIHTKYRFVYTLPELIEKIAIFDNDLDDRMVEIFKLFLIWQINEKDDDNKMESCYFADSDGSPAFVLLDKNRDKGIELPFNEEIKEIYEGVSAQFAKGLEMMPDGDYVVDMNWALKFLDEMNHKN